MFDSFADEFFLEKTSRSLDKIQDPEELRKIAKEILSLYIRHREVTKKIILDK